MDKFDGFYELASYIVYYCHVDSDGNLISNCSGLNLRPATADEIAEASTAEEGFVNAWLTDDEVDAVYHRYAELEGLYQS